MTTHKVHFELQKKVLENMIKTNRGLLLQNKSELPVFDVMKPKMD